MAKAKMVDRKMADAVIAEIMVAVEGVAKKHGLGVVRRSGKYNHEMILPKFELHLVSSNGSGIEQQLFEKDAELLGLKKADFGIEFTANFRKYKIVGLSPNPFRRRRPVIASRLSDNKRFVFEVQSIIRFLGR